MRYLAYLAGVALLICAVAALILVPMGVRNCLDTVDPNGGGRIPCVQPRETAFGWLGQHLLAGGPAFIGTILIVRTALRARR